MTPAPRVSVVLPNYNYARFLDQRIQSLLDQTFADFELIILDDASTDDSRSVIEAYHDSRIVTRFYDQNSGQVYRRWNEGAALANGAYLHIANADDFCDRGFLERLVGALDDNPRAGIAFARSEIVDNGGRRTSCLPKGDAWDRDFTASSAYAGAILATGCRIPTTSAALFRRRDFERCGGFNESFRLAADYWLYANMLSTSELAYISEPLASFRRHGGGATSALRRNLMMKEIYRVLAYITHTYRLGEKDRDAAMDSAARKWLRQIKGSRALADAGLHAGVFRVARRADPRISRRLFRLATRDLAVKLGARG